MERTAVLILGHGSRSAAANAEFEAFVGAYRLARPGLHVAHAYIELALPLLGEALAGLAKGADHVVVLPLFLVAAGHVKHDLAEAVSQARRDFPAVRFTAARPLGVHPGLVDLALERALPALERIGDPAAAPVIVVGRGSSDPDANGDFCKIVRLFAERRGLRWAVPAFIGITYPSFEEAAELAARARPERLAVVPYFLFRGRLVDRLHGQVAAFRKRHPSLATELAPYLGQDDRILALLDERLREATEGGLPLPCDACSYRMPRAAA